MTRLYLVTGAAGHLGSALLSRLLELKCEVRALVLPGEPNIPKGNYELCYGDVTNKASLSTFFDNPDNPDKKELILIHCAGIVTISSKFQQLVYDVNVTGTKNVVDLALDHAVNKLVYVSSVHAIPEKPLGEVISEVYDFNPDDVVGPYAKTKSEATAYVFASAQKGLNASIVHPSGICGPFDNGRGHLTTLVIDYYKRRLTSGIDGGYDFVDVRDVVDGIIACSEKGRAGEGYILSNRYFSVREILYLLHRITGKKAIKNFLPLWFVKLTAPLAEMYYKILKQPPLFTAYSIYTLNSNALFTHEKATRELGYKTREMEDTLRDTIEWLKSEGTL